MNSYENVVIFEPSLNEELIEQAISSISTLITNNGGEVIKIDKWGLRKLAYELNERKQGIYILFIFKATSDFIKRLEEYYRLQDTVIKFMIIKLGKKELATLIKAQEAGSTNSSGAMSQETANVQ